MSKSSNHWRQTASRHSFPAFADLPAQPEMPDPLVMLDGTRITTKKDWFAKRRPELLALFEHYMYGQAPLPPEVRATITCEDRKYFGGKATKRLVTLRYGPKGTPPLHLLLVIPNRRKKPAPVFVGANFSGNHVYIDDPTIPLPQGWMPKWCAGVVDNRSTDAGRYQQPATWNFPEVVARGYALAIFYCGDIDPDLDDFSDGVHAAYRKKGERRGPHDWGTIRAWAWGLSRAVDYLVTDPDLDPKKIIAIGHSRLGKTAVVAAAFDERIAMAIPVQAGCGGTAPSRGTVGESVTKINTVFPHWFCGEFKRFNDRPELLPFDQHCLVALVAPRPVLFSNATEDQWANPAGQFDVLRAAHPVYRLLGSKGLAARKMPKVGKLVDSPLGYFIRPGKHEVNRTDWAAFLAFADRHFGKPK